MEGRRKEEIVEVEGERERERKENLREGGRGDLYHFHQYNSNL